MTFDYTCFLLLYVWEMDWCKRKLTGTGPLSQFRLRHSSSVKIFLLLVMISLQSVWWLLCGLLVRYSKLERKDFGNMTLGPYWVF